MSVASVANTSVSPVPSPEIFGTVKHNDTFQQRTMVKPHEIHSTTEDLKRITTVFNKKLQFVVDHNSNEIIVKVIDKETDKVIKELPPEELQRLHRNLKEAVGLLFDEMV